MSLLVTVVALDLRDVFYLFLDGPGVDTRCRRLVALTLSLCPLGAGNLLASGSGPSSGWRRKSAERKMTVPH